MKQRLCDRCDKLCEEERYYIPEVSLVNAKIKSVKKILTQIDICKICYEDFLDWYNNQDSDGNLPVSKRAFTVTM